MNPAFLVIGDANADVNAELTRFPHEGDDCPLRALGWSSGGSAANVATALALLGARARLLARVGVDPAAAVALRAAAAAKVDLDLVQRDAAIATGICFAAVSPGGERTFFSHRGANSALDGGGPADPLEGAGWVHIAGHALLEGSQRGITLALATAAQRRGIPLSLDLCLPLLRGARELVLELVPRLSVLFANELELPALVGAPRVGDLVDPSLDRFSHDGPVVAAKLGARGSRLGGRARADVPAFSVTARDTTGAGDAYVAGLLFALSRGAEPATAALLGNALGALTATRQGAADALPSRDEVRSFLEIHGELGALPLLAPPPSE